MVLGMSEVGLEQKGFESYLMEAEQQPSWSGGTCETFIYNYLSQDNIRWNSFDLNCERLAFSFTEDYRWNGNRFGYPENSWYGPLLSTNELAMPGIDELTPEVLNYWRGRSLTAF